MKFIDRFLLPCIVVSSCFAVVQLNFQLELETEKFSNRPINVDNQSRLHHTLSVPQGRPQLKTAQALQFAVPAPFHGLLPVQPAFQ